MRKRSFICFSLTVVILLACGSGSGPNTTPPKGDTDAVSKWRQAILSYPDSPALRLKLVEAFEERKDYASAVAIVDSLLAQDSTIAFLHYRKAQLRLAAGDTLAGIKGLKRTLAYAPDNGDVLLELGYVLANRGDDEARTIADTIISVSKDADLRSRARLLKGIFLSNKGDKAAALKEYDASIVDNYTFLDAYIERAIVLYELKRYAEAQVTLDQAQAIRPATAEVYLWKGKCHQAAGQRAEAMDNYRKCLGLDAGMKEAADLLAGLEAAK